METDIFVVNKSIHGKSHKYLWTDDQINYIHDLYINHGKSATEISKMFKVSPPTIVKILKDFNVVWRNNSHRIYDLKEDYFDCLDTSNKLYFLGLLFADGCLSNHNEISISLQEKDSYILEIFKDELCSNRPIEFRDYSSKNINGEKYQNQYRLRVDSSHMFQTLESYGLCRNKSLVLDFPCDIPSQYLNDFIRGYWDGDGYIGEYHRTDDIDKMRSACGITGTFSFCSSVKDILHNALGVGGSLHEAGNHNGITYVLDYGGNLQVKKILDWLYLSSDLKLNRKYRKYLSMFYSDLLTDVA